MKNMYLCSDRIITGKRNQFITEYKMKKSTIPLISRFVLVLALLSTFFTSMAYDFEVDGIYYNKTSNNTVEVTYRDEYKNSYSGKVEIPSSVFYDNKSYTVNIIGEDAFYDCIELHSIIIPSTITSIERNAFVNCYNLEEVKCMATIPPSLNGQVYNGCLSYGYGYGVLYNYYYDYENGLNTSGIDAVLYVSSEVYDEYKNDDDWSSNFSIIAKIGSEQTVPPTIIAKGFDLDENNYFGYQFADSMYVYFLPEEDCKIFVGNTTTGRWDSHSHGTDWEEYNGERWFPGMFYDSEYSSPYTVDCTVYAYAVAEGKAPSPVSVLSELYYSPSRIVETDDIKKYDIPYIMNDGDKLFDLKYNGLYYSVLNDSSLALVKGMINHCTEHHLFFASPRFDEDNVYFDEFYYEDSVELLYYSGNINIPEYASGESVLPFDSYFVGGNITSINQNAFTGCKELLRVTIPNTVLTLDSFAFSECGVIPYIELPSSVHSVGSNCFRGSSIDYLYITGNGAWAGASLDVSVQRLDIASGITAVPGLKVNPREVYCYASVPPTCDENTFMDYTGTLHVPESSLAAYFTAPYWCNFLNIVGGAVELTELTLNVDSAELMVGKQLSLNATLEPANASADNIAWTSSDENVASVVDGIVTAKAKGECDIIVTCLDKRAVCHVIVNEILPTDIALNEESIMMELDSTYTLIASITPSNSTFTTVNWSSSNSAVATVNADGVVTAVGVGECDIIASCRELSAVCHVKVLEKFVYITIDQHRASLLPNHILTLTPTVTPVATVLVVSSSNPSVAAARLANGKVQVVGVAPGSAVIKVSSADGNAFADSCVVNVYTELGDVNGDGFVKINDVTVLIDYLLDSTMSQFDIGKADLNCDGKINISDVTLLIDCLLGGYVPMSTRETFTVNGVSFTMIRVPAGTFMMGATQEQGDDATEREKPAHEVTLTSSYLLGETEVTQRLWLAVMGTNPSKHMGDLDKPVENVTWPDCQKFITHLNALTGQNFRLPSEAEWEYAARGANKSRGYKYSGSDNIDEVGWVTGTTTHPVGSLVPNEMNLYDMSGNVDEWIQDYWYTYSSASQTDPKGPESGTSHVYRGGSWYGGPTASRVSCRMYRSETFQRGTLGLRLAL